jgi:hypothetical protein
MLTVKRKVDYIKSSHSCQEDLYSTGNLSKGWRCFKKLVHSDEKVSRLFVSCHSLFRMSATDLRNGHGAHRSTCEITSRIRSICTKKIENSSRNSGNRIFEFNRFMKNLIFENGFKLLSFSTEILTKSMICTNFLEHFWWKTRNFHLNNDSMRNLISLCFLRPASMKWTDTLQS